MNVEISDFLVIFGEKDQFLTKFNVFIRICSDEKHDIALVTYHNYLKDCFEMEKNEGNPLF